MNDSTVRHFFNNLSYLKNSSDRIAVRSDIIKKSFNGLENKQILDIGCGNGSLSSHFLEKGNRVTMLDISEKMLEEAKSGIRPEQLDKVTFVNDTVDALDDCRKFNLILCVGVLAHVEDPARLLEKIDRLLADDGYLVLETTPNPYPLGKVLWPYYYLRAHFTGLSQFNYRKNRVSLNSIVEITGRRGMQLLQSFRYYIPLPGMSHWPQRIKLAYTRSTLSNKFLSRLGTEHILIFRREHRPAA
jgi:ubiquinone/menaquinone biosynthesis C-methylase UbiE